MEQPKGVGDREIPVSRPGRRPAAWLATMLREVSVSVRAYYEALPSMAGRGTDTAGESRRHGGNPVQSPEARSEIQNRRKWSAGRRGVRAVGR